MIPVRHPLSERITDDPRLSAGQLVAIQKAAKADQRAVILGLDAKLRPVLRAKLSGPGGRVEYALMRNGDPAKPVKPYAEVWR